MGSHLSDVWFQVTDLQVTSGNGSWVTTADGAEYLDFSAGIAVVSTGHCHPKVVAAIQEQATKFIHAQVNCYRHPLLERSPTGSPRSRRTASTGSSSRTPAPRRPRAR